MSEPLETSWNESMLSAEDSPARTSASPASESVSTVNVRGSGVTFPGWFARCDPGMSSWRTSQRCLEGDWAEFLETWPRAGMTRNGIAYRRVPLVPITSEIARGLFPTPDASVSTGYNQSASSGAAVRWSLGGLALRGELVGHPRGSLHPEWVEQAMGYPIGWTDLGASATP
jgi:hypothetical protein